VDPERANLRLLIAAWGFLPFVPEEVPLRIGQQAGSISSGRVFAMSLSSNERP
jgi:hypothetical protein